MGQNQPRSKLCLTNWCKGLVAVRLFLSERCDTVRGTSVVQCFSSRLLQCSHFDIILRWCSSVSQNLNSSMGQVSLLNPPVLASRHHPWRTATCRPQYRSRPSLSATERCLVPTSQSFFPLLFSMYGRCTSAPSPRRPHSCRASSAICLRERVCRDVPLDHRCCFGCRADIEPCFVLRNAILWFMPALVNTLFVGHG